jgi:hypothetical protein
MPEIDALQTLAQFGIALAGFTSIVVVFRRGEREFHPADRFRVFAALAPSLMGAFLALFPVGVYLMGVTDATLWRVSSAILAASGIGFLVSNMIAARRIPAEAKNVLSRGLWPLFRSLQVIPVLVGIANGFGFFLPPQGGLYFLGVLSLLVFGAIVFVRVIFVRPAG